MSVKSKFLQSGSFGCVFRPPLRCAGEDESERKSNDYVARLSNNADAFIEKSIPWREIDPEGEYFLTPEEKACDVHPNNKRKFALRYDCKMSKVSFMKYGGVDLIDVFVKKQITRKDFFPLLEAFEHVLKGMQLAHANNLYHLDLKVENILISKDDIFHMRIIDFDYTVSKKDDILTPIPKRFQSIQTRYHPLDIYLAYILQNSTKEPYVQQIEITLKNSKTFQQKGFYYMKELITQFIRKQIKSDAGRSFIMYPFSNMSATMQNQIYSRFKQVVSKIYSSEHAEIELQKAIETYLAASDVYMLGITLADLIYNTTGYYQSIGKWSQSDTEIKPVLQYFGKRAVNDYEVEFMEKLEYICIQPLFTLVADMIKPITVVRATLPEVIERFHTILENAKRNISEEELEIYLQTLPKMIPQRGGRFRSTRKKRSRQKRQTRSK